MKNDALPMASFRERWQVASQWVFVCAWRIAILLLPWQTRYFIEGPMVQGFAWEQGRLSFYASWIPLLLTIGAAFFSFSDDQEALKDPKEVSRLRWMAIAGGLILLPVLLTSSFRSSLQWTLEVLLLGLFFWSLARQHVSGRSVLIWFAISLIPQAFLGLWQYARQVVDGSAWLGIATQDPASRGVSVVEAGGRRVLRAYGGLPHPNILGGWLALGLWAFISLRALAVQARERRIWTYAIFLCSAALVFSFSRSAWLAFFAGSLFFLVSTFVSQRSRFGAVFMASAIALGCMGAFGLASYDLIQPRVMAQGRLESKSVDERIGALRQGWQAARAKPFFGTGYGAYNFVQQTLVPPHMTWLLALAEIGLVGLAGWLLLGMTFFSSDKSPPRDWRWLGALSPIIILLVVSAFDYYPWAFWSGKSLLALAVFFTLFPPFSTLDTSPHHSA